MDNSVIQDDFSDPDAPQAGSKPLEIVVDDRERPSGLIECLQARENIHLVVRRLKAGDYLVDNRVLIERKTIADLAISIIDGRLFSQAGLLAESGYHPVMLVEGHIQEDAGGVSREAIQGAIITLAVFFNLPCLRSFDVQESAQLICYTGAQIQRRLNHGVYRHGYRPSGRRKRRLFILQGLPGVGPVLAARLLEKFGSVENVFRADVEALAEVAGIGRKTAEAIRALLGPDDEDLNQV